MPRQIFFRSQLRDLGLDPDVFRQPPVARPSAQPVLDPSQGIPLLQALGDAGQALVDGLEQARRQRQDFLLTDAETELQRRLLTWQTDYQQTHLGRDALNAQQDFLQAFADIAGGMEKLYADRLDAGAQAALRQRFALHGIRTLRHGASWQVQQQAVWQRQQEREQLALLDADIAADTDDTDWHEQALEHLQGQWEARHPGEDATAYRQELRQHYAQTLLEQRMARGDLEGAEAALNRFGETDLPPEHVRHWHRMLEAGRRQQQQDAILGDFAHDPAMGIAALATQEGRAQYGLGGTAAQEVSELLHMRRTHMKQQEKQQREMYETAVFTGAVNLALGANGEKADPVRAYRMIADDQSLDDTSKLEALKALRAGTLDQDDPGTILDFQNRMANGETVTDAEIAKSMAAGKVSFATKDRLVKLRDMTNGPQGYAIMATLSTLNETQRKASMTEPTPGQLLAHTAALRELQDAITEAQAKGTLSEILDPGSEKYVLPGIVRRHQPTLRQQVHALQHKTETDRAANAFGGGVAVAVLQRQPGENVNAYMQRRSTGHTEDVS